MTDDTTAPQRSPAAERMRLSRARRRKGLRMIRFAIRDSEVDGLVNHGLLDTACRNDRVAVAKALGGLLDRFPISRWQLALRPKRGT